MQNISFTLNQEYIELIKLLKFVGIAENGSHAKMMVEEGEVKVNGQKEFRKRAKLKINDIIEVMDCRVIIK